jgi:hypothetical protein
LEGRKKEHHWEGEGRKEQHHWEGRKEEGTSLGGKEGIRKKHVKPLEKKEGENKKEKESTKLLLSATQCVKTVVILEKSALLQKERKIRGFVAAIRQAKMTVRTFSIKWYRKD